MENKKQMGYFAQEKPVLESHQVKTCVTTQNFDSLQQCLKIIPEGNYQVAVYQINEMKLGYYQNKTFTFSDGSVIDEKYFIEMRLFNKDSEIYILKTASSYKIRIICDGASDGENFTVTDSNSVIFGSRCETNNLPEGFVMVKEQGRKIRIVLPCAQKADNYAVTTRSYVTFDKDTGLSGYGFYRWVEIMPFERG